MFLRAEIPAFELMGSVLARHSQSLLPPERLTIAEAAIKYRKLQNGGGGYSGDWNFDAAPYLRRPMECLSDEAFRLVVVQGPAQSGKSEIPNNWLLWSAIVSPANMVWLQIDKDLMQAYVKEKINPMIRLAPDLRRKQLATPSADNILAKEFEGMIVNFIWPTGANFRMRSAPRYVIDDFDGVPQEIGDEGDPVTLLGARQTTFEGREKGFIASSPKLGEEAGIAALVATGTDETWQVLCPSCDERFAIDFARLAFKRDGSPEEAAASAHVICPANGCIIEPRQKRDLIDSGVWAAKGQDVTPDGILIGEAPRCDIASFRIDGLMGFTSWPRLAQLCREAEQAFERTQDEQKLRAFINTRVGKNYISRHEDAQPVTAGQIKQRAGLEDYSLRTVPAGVRFLTAAVDVQAKRFAVQVEGHGADGECWLIDRFDILTADAEGRVAIAPDQVGGHWDLLLPRVLGLRYPLAADMGRGLPVASIAIDSGGLPGVTDFAKDFMRRALAAAIEPWRIMLVKGANTRAAAPLPQHPTFDTDNNGKRRPDAVPIYVLGVHQIKDIVDVRLRRMTPGAGYRHAPADAPDNYFIEIVNERKEDGVWVKKGPNESWDLAVYNEAARMQMRAERVKDWQHPPIWARPVTLSESPVTPTPSLTPASPASRGRGVRGRVR